MFLKISLSWRKQEWMWIHSKIARMHKHYQAIDQALPSNRSIHSISSNYSVPLPIHSVKFVHSFSPFFPFIHVHFAHSFSQFHPFNQSISSIHSFVHSLIYSIILSLYPIIQSNSSIHSVHFVHSFCPFRPFILSISPIHKQNFELGWKCYILTWQT